MHMIVVGCGRVGSTVARELSASGHDVVVVDRNAAAFRRSRRKAARAARERKGPSLPSG